LENCSKEILEFFKENTKQSIFDKNAHSVLVECLSHLSGEDNLSIFENIWELAKAPIADATEENPHVLFHPVASRVIKILATLDVSHKSDSGEGNCCDYFYLHLCTRLINFILFF
jgi:hypothetical protein